MKRVQYNVDWPDSWKMSFGYDQLEIYDSGIELGYRYSYQERARHTFDLIQSVIGRNAKILDLAAAQGNFSLKLAELGYQVTWNDLRSELIEYVKLKWEKGNIEFSPGNIFELSTDAKYDLVLATEVIEHVAHPDQFLNKIAEILKPGGYLVITTPNGAYMGHAFPRFTECHNPEQYESLQFKPNSDGHIFLLHEDELELISKSSDLQLVKVSYFNNPLTSGHLKLRYLLRVLPRPLVEKFERISQSCRGKSLKALHAGMIVLFKKS